MYQENEEKMAAAVQDLKNTINRIKQGTVNVRKSYTSEYYFYFVFKLKYLCIIQ